MTKKYWFTSLSRLRAPGEQSYFYPHLLCPWPSTGPWDSHLTRAQTMPSGNSQFTGGEKRNQMATECECPTVQTRYMPFIT